MAEGWPGGRVGLDEALKENATARTDKGLGKSKPKAKTLSREQADKMAQNLDDYDGSIVGGRLRQR